MSQDGKNFKVGLTDSAKSILVLSVINISPFLICISHLVLNANLQYIGMDTILIFLDNLTKYSTQSSQQQSKRSNQ